MRHPKSPGSDCRDCRLHAGRTRIVNGTGPMRSRIVFVGEAPGRDEDLQGRPFVGMAGRILSEALEEAGVRREDVYVTNLVRCRPPGNRRPRVDELRACAAHLNRELSAVNPVVICALGQTVARSLIAAAGSMAALVGREMTVSVGGREFKGMIAYHPAACLYRRKNLDSFKSAVRRSLEAAGMV